MLTRFTTVQTKRIVPSESTLYSATALWSQPYRVIQMLVGALNLRDAGATHVRNRTKVQAAHNPLYAVV